MKKLIYTLFLILGLGQTAMADDYIIQFVNQGTYISHRTSNIDSIYYEVNYLDGSMNSIRLSADDGTDAMFNLSDSLTIKFDEKSLIASDGWQTITVALDEVNIEYSTEEAPTGISDARELEYTFGSDAITFRGLKAGQPVRVFSVDGKLLMTIPADNEDGKTSLKLSDLPSGISIIQAGKYNLKYHRK